ILRRFPRMTNAPPPRVAALAILTVALFALFGVLPIFQRIVSAIGDPSGAAVSDYVFRGIVAAQQLVIGGLVIAILPEWAKRIRRGEAIGRRVAATALFGGLMLMTASAVGLVVAPALTALLFQRGAFSSADSAAVGLLVRAALP